MKKNMHTLDRVIRVVLAIIFSALYFTGTLTGPVGIVLLVLGVVFLLTSLVGSCPLYSLFGFSTCQVESTEK
jgi:hypothetical protein